MTDVSSRAGGGEHASSMAPAPPPPPRGEVTVDFSRFMADFLHEDIGDAALIDYAREQLDWLDLELARGRRARPVQKALP